MYILDYYGYKNVMFIIIFIVSINMLNVPCQSGCKKNTLSKPIFPDIFCHSFFNFRAYRFSACLESLSNIFSTKNVIWTYTLYQHIIINFIFYARCLWSLILLEKSTFFYDMSVLLTRHLTCVWNMWVRIKQNTVYDKQNISNECAWIMTNELFKLQSHHNLTQTDLKKGTLDQIKQNK